MAQVNAGRVRFVSKGEYNNSTQYYLFDLVNYNGNSYYAKENTLGNLPTDTSKWQLIAEKGDTGATGATGATGNGISNIQKTSTSGLVDTYTITYTDGTTTTYQVTNGENGEVTQEQLDEVIEENTYLNSIIDQLPRVNGTGDTITLNNTIEAKMKSKLSPSELRQATTTGKNLLPRATTSETKNGVTFTANEDGSVKVSGTATANTYYNLTKQTLQAGTYTLSGGVNSNCKIISNYGGSYQISQGAGVTFTLSEETTPTEFYIQITNGTAITTPIIFYPMIRLASITDDTYEPYTGGIASPNPQYSQTIHTTTGDNVIRDEGKNLFVLKNATQSGWNVSIDNPLKGKSAGDYTISCVNKYITSNKGIAICFNNTPNTDAGMIGSYFTGFDFGNTRMNQTRTITQEQLNATYMVILGSDNANSLQVIENMKIMIEKGSTATNYEPYNKTDYPLTLGTLEYSKIGNYEDEFIYNTTDTNLQLNKWYLKKNIGKVVLDGSESWSDRPNYINADRFILDRTFPTNNRNMICNYFQVNQSTDDTYPYLTNNGTQCLINFSEKGTTTLAQFKTWLSTHNTIVNYPLATPTYILLNDTLQTQLTNIYNNMMSKKTQTNISQINDDLPMVITASALLDLNTLVQ